MQNQRRFSWAFILATLTTITAIAAVIFFAWQERMKAASGVIVQRTDATSVTAYLIWPNPNADAGLAHYVEHLAWLNAVGSQERGVGRHSNAWTSDYAIGYWLSGPSDDLQIVLERLLKVATPLTLDASFASEERDVVMREYDLRIAGNVDAQANESAERFLYDGNHLAKSVIGSRSDITALTYDAARSFHADTHMIEAATLIVVGDVSRRQVSRALRDIGHDKSDFGVAGVTMPPFSLGPSAIRQFQFPKDDRAPRVQFRKVVRLEEPIEFDVLEANAALLQNILESNVPGGLAGPLRFDGSYARSFQVAVWPLDENHIEFYISAAPDRGVTLTALTIRIEGVLQSIAEDGIPMNTYQRIKDRFGGFWPNWSDTEETQDWMADYIVNRVSIQRRPLSETDLRNLRNTISYNTIGHLLRAISGDGRAAITFIGPERTFE